MIKAVVEELIRKHGTVDPRRICEDLDTLVISVPLVKVNGFYQRFEDQDIIYVNQDLNYDETTLVMAHELGHLILHKDINTILLDTYGQVVTKYELEANAFAILLLKDQLNLNEDIPLLGWRLDNQALINMVL